MQIEISLVSFDFCDGCPCLFEAPNEYPYSCKMGYWHGEGRDGINKGIDKGFKRPNICIRNHGR